MATDEATVVARRGVVRSAIILGLGQGTARLVVAAYFLVLVRRLVPGAYGDFATAAALLGILVAFADGGLSRFLIRELPHATRDETLLSNVLIVRATWTVVITVAAIAVAATGVFGVSGPGPFVVVFAVALAGEALAVGFESSGIGTERPWRVAAGQITWAGALALYLFLIAARHPTATTALGGFAVASVAKLAYQSAVWARELHVSFPRVARIRMWVAEATPYLLLTALGTIYYRVDTVILRARTDATATAPYAAGYRLVDLGLAIGGVFTAAMAPHVSRAHRAGTGAVVGTWFRFLVATAVLATPPAIGAAIFAYPIASVLFGHRYETSAGTIIRILMPGLVFMLLQLINALVLLTSTEQRLLLRLSIVHVAFNVGLTWWLVGRWGGNGAAAATSVSEAATFAYFAVIVRKRFG